MAPRIPTCCGAFVGVLGAIQLPRLPPNALRLTISPNSHATRCRAGPRCSKEMHSSEAKLGIRTLLVVALVRQGELADPRIRSQLQSQRVKITLSRRCARRVDGASPQ